MNAKIFGIFMLGVGVGIGIGTGAGYLYWKRKQKGFEKTFEERIEKELEEIREIREKYSGKSNRKNTEEKKIKFIKYKEEPKSPVAYDKTYKPSLSNLVREKLEKDHDEEYEEMRTIEDEEINEEEQELLEYGEMKQREQDDLPRHQIIDSDGLIIEYKNNEVYDILKLLYYVKSDVLIDINDEEIYKDKVRMIGEEAYNIIKHGDVSELYVKNNVLMMYYEIEVINDHYTFETALADFGKQPTDGYKLNEDDKFIKKNS